MNNGLKTKIRTFNVNLKSTKYLGKNLIAYKLSYFVGHSLPKTREIQGVPKKTWEFSDEFDIVFIIN